MSDDSFILFGIEIDKNDFIVNLGANLAAAVIGFLLILLWRASRGH